jgi:hypothetical protein
MRMIRNENVRFGRHIDIEVSYKISQLEIPKLVLILHYPACFQKGLLGGNFEQKHPWSFRGSFGKKKNQREELKCRLSQERRVAGGGWGLK